MIINNDIIFKSFYYILVYYQIAEIIMIANGSLIQPHHQPSPAVVENLLKS